MTDLSSGAAVSEVDVITPGLTEIVGQRRLDRLHDLPEAEILAWKARLSRQLKDAEPTISEPAAEFAAERLFENGVLNLPEQVHANIIFIKWLGYRDARPVQVRYFLDMAETEKGKGKENYAALDVSNGKKNGRFVYTSRHIARVLEWAFNTGSYRKTTDTHRVEPRRRKKVSGSKRIRSYRTAIMGV